jgi:CheY-like chemotaxis protein
LTQATIRFVLVYQPCVADCRWKAVAEMRDAAPFRSRPVVLIAEDEFLIRMNAVAMMEKAGYDVIEASNANEAIDILQERTDVGIVFTDVEMPGSMDGLKLARYIRKRWPPIQLLVTSGRYHLDDSDLPLRGKFVPKPYDFDRLVNVIRSLA